MITTEIPVENYFYLLSYAWDMLTEKEHLKVDFVKCNNLNDLYARILCRGIEIIARKGIKKEYQNRTDELSVIKGKINFKDSLGNLLSSSNKLYCEFDDLTYNILENQILFSTLKKLLSDDIDRTLKLKIKNLLLLKGDIEYIQLRKSSFDKAKTKNKHGIYSLLINLCEIIYLSGIPDYKDGSRIFRDFINDERELARLFEKFVYNFYRSKLKSPEKVGFQNKIQWALNPMDEISKAYLPSMNTDITIENESRKIIIDTKFYKNTFQVNYGKESIHSGNLYQLQSYVINDKESGSQLRRLGLLLYPTVSKNECLNYQFDEDTFIQVQTLDLSQPWQAIEEQLLSIITF